MSRRVLNNFEQDVRQSLYATNLKFENVNTVEYDLNTAVPPFEIDLTKSKHDITLINVPAIAGATVSYAFVGAAGGPTISTDALVMSQYVSSTANAANDKQIGEVIVNRTGGANGVTLTATNVTGGPETFPENTLRFFLVII